MHGVSDTTRTLFRPRPTLVYCRSSVVLSYLTQGKAAAAKAKDAGAGSSGGGGGNGRAAGRAGLPPIVVNLNSSSSELKLLRVLQTLVNLSGKDTGESAGQRVRTKRGPGLFVIGGLI